MANPGRTMTIKVPRFDLVEKSRQQEVVDSNGELLEYMLKPLIVVTRLGLRSLFNKVKDDRGCTDSQAFVAAMSGLLGRANRTRWPVVIPTNTIWYEQSGVAAVVLLPQDWTDHAVERWMDWSGAAFLEVFGDYSADGVSVRFAPDPDTLSNTHVLDALNLLRRPTAGQLDAAERKARKPKVNLVAKTSTVRTPAPTTQRLKSSVRGNGNGNGNGGHSRLVGIHSLKGKFRTL